MTDDRAQRSSLKHHAKVQSFRLFTVVLAWLLIAIAFYYRPDFIKHALRVSTKAIETVGDAIPSPWGDRIEILLREVGGIIWLQITAFILSLRIIFWLAAALWRRAMF